jgi:hypothetical protein
MLTAVCTNALVLALLAPFAAQAPSAVSPRTQGLSPADVAALHAAFDPGLESQRAGRVQAPAALDAAERAELGAAQQASPALEAMRGGFAPTDQQWTWIAIGAGIVLLIVLIA